MSASSSDNDVSIDSVLSTECSSADSSSASSIDITNNDIDDLPIFCWCPNDIFLPGADGHKINLLDTFNVSNDQAISRITSPDSLSTYLPVTIYPPTFDGWNILSTAIINACKHHSHIIKVSSTNKKQGSNKFDEYSYVLKCCRGCRQAPSKKKKFNNNDSNQYKKDRFVNKLASIRGTSKHEGKGFVRRTSSHRNNLNLCPF